MNIHELKDGDLIAARHNRKLLIVATTFTYGNDIPALKKPICHCGMPAHRSIKLYDSASKTDFEIVCCKNPECLEDPSLNGAKLVCSLE